MLLSFPPLGMAGIDLWLRIACPVDRPGILNRENCSEMFQLLDRGAIYWPMLRGAAASARLPVGAYRSTT